MGKTKIQVIDDSAPMEEKKKQKPSKKAEKQTIDDRKVEGSTLKVEGGKSKEESLPSTLNLQDSTIHPPSSTVKKIQKPGKAKPRSKKYQEISKDLDRTKSYSLVEAVDMVKKLSYAKFNATIEAHINTYALGLRGFVSLPFVTGKKLKILSFPPAKLNLQDKKELEDEGVVFGDDSTLDEISKGNPDLIGVDLIITAPEWMPKLAKAAKVLGPKGLMPNPKNGTITDDLKKAVESYQAGKTEYKTESKAPVIHLALGKLKQPNEELASNIKTILNTLGKSKVKKVALSPTMGPSVKLDLASV